MTDSADYDALPLASEGVPICKASDGLGPIKALCGSGNYNLAEMWANVTCGTCRVIPPGETDAAE